MMMLNYLSHPSAIYDRLFSHFGLAALLSLDSRFTIARDVHFRGSPTFCISKRGRLRIDKGAVINSWRFDYHTQMAQGCHFNVRLDGNISIGENTRIHGSAVTAYKSVSIGSDCLIAANCMIMDCGGHPVGFPDVRLRMQQELNGLPNVGRIAPVVVEDCVFIGANSVVMPGVTIGYGSVVAAGSVVTKNIPSMVVVAGNPAKVVKANLEDPETSGTVQD